MDESLKWMFQLFDHVSSPANRIHESLKKLMITMEDGKKVTATFGASTQKAGGGLFGLGAALGGWGEAAEKVWNVVSGLVDKVVQLAQVVGGAAFEFGKFAVDALAFKESTLASFELILGTKEEANSMFKQAADFARVTPFETEDVVTGFKQALSAGFTKAEVPIVFQAVGDVAAASGFDSTVMPRMMTALSQIKAAGHLMGQDLMQVTNATSAGGIGRKQIFEAIGKQMKVSSNQVQGLISAGLVDSDTAVFAILDAIKSKTGELGKVMEVQSTTIKGLFSTLQSAPKDFFLAMDLKNLPGLDAFKGFLINLIQLFDTSSATGKRMLGFLQDVVNEGFTRLFGKLAGKDGFQTLEWAFNAVIDGLQEVWRWILIAWDAFGIFWDTIKPLRDDLAEMFSAFGPGDAENMRNGVLMLAWAFGELANALRLISIPFQALKGMADIINGFQKGGEDAASGFGMGLTSMIGASLGPVGMLGATAVNGLRTSLDSHSPSEAFAEIGRDSALGYQLGLEGGLSGVQGAVGQLGVTPGGGTAGGGGRSTTITVPITIEVHGANAGEVARELEAQLPSTLTTLFERLAIESGMAEAPT